MIRSLFLNKICADKCFFLNLTPSTAATAVFCRKYKYVDEGVDRSDRKILYIRGREYRRSTVVTRMRSNIFFRSFRTHCNDLLQRYKQSLRKKNFYDYVSPRFSGYVTCHDIMMTKTSLLPSLSSFSAPPLLSFPPSNNLSPPICEATSTTNKHSLYLAKNRDRRGGTAIVWHLSFRLMGDDGSL